MAHTLRSSKANFKTALPSRSTGFNLFVAAVVAVLMLATPGRGQELQLLRGHVPQAVSVSQVVKPLASATPMNMAIGLPLRNQSELDTLLVQLSDPTSPNFHHYLTPEQFTAKFGPTEQDYQRLIDFVQGQGLVVTGTHSNRMLLDVSGASGDVEKALHVKMMTYRHPVRGNFQAPDREPSLDVQVPMLDISGLDNFVVPRPMQLTQTQIQTQIQAQTQSQTTAPMVTGTGPGGYFIGKDFRAAYAPGVTLTGSGQVVGLLEFDGFFAGDVQKNFAQAGMTPVPIQTVLVDGVSGSAGSANTEVILDIMMASYMAPGLSKVIVYEGLYPNDVLNRMATDNLAQQLSSSWGFGGVNATTEQIFKQYIAQGQSLLQASGDSGAYKNGVMTPSDDPNLTVVGGTSLTTSGSGGPRLSESAWSGSGGGFSTVYPIPSYQLQTSMAGNSGSVKMRNLPDVAMTADIQMFLIQGNGQAIGVGGTSAAAPLWAGFVALANQQAAANAKPRIGFLNPLIYNIGNSANYTADFNDVRSGNNGYAAVTGYDLATGWGSPAGQHLIYDLTSTSGAPSFTLSSSSSALTIRQAASASATLTVAKINSFSSSVTLAASGLPSGVTAVFSPATATTTSTVTFTASATAVVGVYPVMITGIYGTLSSAASITLTVVAPSFTLSASPAALTVPQSKSGSSILSVTGQNGFSGNVALSATGLPTGVTAVFSPASTSSTSTVTFAASSTATPGTYTVIVSGLSGTLRSTASITLTIVAPAFTLSTTQTALTIPQSKSGSSILSVAGQNGFSGSVALSATGLPTGVTAVFSPASTTGTSTVTFSASSTATTGIYTVIVSGLSGTLRSTASITLTIVAPTFTLSASPAAMTVARSTSGSSSLSVAGVNGFSASVALSATGLPAGVTAVFSPASTTSTSTVTFSASSTATAGTYNVIVSGLSGTLKTTTIALTVTAPNFTLAFQPATLQLPRGSSSNGIVTQAAQNGFQGAAKLTVSGLPTGVTATIGATTAAGSTPITLVASTTAAAGAYTVTVTGVSGALTNSCSFLLTVLAPTPGAGLVNLSSVYNVNAFVADGAPFSGAGIDGGLNGSSTAYSASLVGSQQTIGGTLFYFGAANALDAVSSATIALPPGQYTSLKLLATAVNGHQLAQVFKVTYTDGTVSTITQSLSDWFTPQVFPAETTAIQMAYRDNGQGQRDNRTFYLYEYVFALNAGKTVASVTLPANRNVVVLAASLAGATAAVR